MEQDVIDRVLKLLKKGPESMVKTNKQVIFFENIATDEPTIAVAGADTTWVHEPQKYQNDDDISS